MAQHQTPDHSKDWLRARAIGAAAGTLTIGVLIMLLTYGLRGVNFRPLQHLVTLDDQAYRALFPPTLDLTGPISPVVFIDIDDYTLDKWSPIRFTTSCSETVDPPPTKLPAAFGTPRGLIAAITKAMRKAGAAVVFLDFDFRNMLPDDPQLARELACKNDQVPREKNEEIPKTKVLLPHFFVTGLQPACLPQKNGLPTEETNELETPFEIKESDDLIEPVHPVITSGDYGLIEGICSYYSVRSDQSNKVFLRPAAMVMAVSLARPDLRSEDFPGEQMRSFQWRISKKTDNLVSEKTKKLVYLRINAGILLDSSGSIDMSKINASLIHNAIVIVGATHKGAGDTYLTPVGPLPGALVHANLGVDLQAPADHEVRLPVLLVVELLVLILFTLIIYQIRTRIKIFIKYMEIMPWRTIIELVLMVALWLIFVAITYVLEKYFGDFAGGWRFGFLSFTLGVIIVTLIEVISWIAKSVETFFEPKNSKEIGPVTIDVSVNIDVSKNHQTGNAVESQGLTNL